MILTADRLAGSGFVTNIGGVAPLQHFITDALDHRDLNTVLDLELTRICPADRVIVLVGWSVCSSG